MFIQNFLGGILIGLLDYPLHNLAISYPVFNCCYVYIFYVTGKVLHEAIANRETVILKKMVPTILGIGVTTTIIRL